jgi:hypothetical protein
MTSSELVCVALLLYVLAFALGMCFLWTMYVLPHWIRMLLFLGSVAASVWALVILYRATRACILP